MILKNQLFKTYERYFFTGSQANGNQIILSEINLLVGGKRTTDVSAISQTELLKLPKAAFEW